MNKTEVFIEKARLKHGDTYDYSKVEYEKALEKVIIICKTHGEFKQQANLHYIGKGCKLCGTERTSNSKTNKSKNNFVEKARSIHGDTYDYSLVNITKTTFPVVIICKTHGEFIQTPHSHLRGSGCYKCGKEDMANAQRLTLEEFTRHARERFTERCISISRMLVIMSMLRLGVKFMEHSNRNQVII